RRSSCYSFSKNSQPEQEIKIPPPTLRSRSFTRFTIRVGFPHLGQSVLLDVSITFLRSAVLAILAMVFQSPVRVCHFPTAWSPPGATVVIANDQLPGISV